MKFIKNVSLLKGIVMELRGINNIFPMTKGTVACPKVKFIRYMNLINKKLCFLCFGWALKAK